MNFLFQIWRFMYEFIKIVGLKMANLAIGQGLNADAGFSALVYAHEVAFE
jgi:hypothetical protein